MPAQGIGGANMIKRALATGAAVLDATVGFGGPCLYGPEVLQRGAAHGAFPRVFNSVSYGTAASHGR